MTLETFIITLAGYLCGMLTSSLLWWLADRKARRDAIADAEAHRQAIIAAKYAGVSAQRRAEMAKEAL